MQEQEFDPTELPTLPPLGICKRILLWVLSPFLILQATYDILSAQKHYCAVKKDVPMTNKKNGAYTQDLNLAEMKAMCKLKNCTLNDYIMSVYSNSLYEFFD
jgi:hypothetical protein